MAQKKKESLREFLSFPFLSSAEKQRRKEKEADRRRVEINRPRTVSGFKLGRIKVMGAPRLEEALIRGNRAKNQLRVITNAIASPKTPASRKPALREAAKRMRSRLEVSRKRKSNRR